MDTSYGQMLRRQIGEVRLSDDFGKPEHIGGTCAAAVDHQHGCLRPIEWCPPLRNACVAVSAGRFVLCYARARPLRCSGGIEKG
jgi:hypothetical protein